MQDFLLTLAGVSILVTVLSFIGYFNEYRTGRVGMWTRFENLTLQQRFMFLAAIFGLPISMILLIGARFV